jgi:hypothetical protein
MRIARILGPLVLALALEGCAAVGLAVVGAGVGVGAGAGIEHTMNGIVYKTFDAPTNELRFATLKTLDHLGMPVTTDEKSEEGWKLSATATERSIDIELQQLTEKTTRMRVVAYAAAQAPLPLRSSAELPPCHEATSVGVVIERGSGCAH